MSVPVSPSADQPISSQSSRPVATFTQYADAQAAVDFLSDQKFDVSTVQIVGRGLQTVEQVVGRLTVMKAALTGLFGGAWFGLMIGLLFGLLLPTHAWLQSIVWGVLFGAIFGLISGAIGHAMTGGRRDFASVQALQASEYVVTVLEPKAAEAEALLARR